MLSQLQTIHFLETSAA